MYASTSPLDFYLHFISRDPRARLWLNLLIPLQVPHPSELAYQTGGIFMQIVQRCLLSVFLLRRVRRYVQSDCSLSVRPHISLWSVMLQPVLQNLEMIADRMKNLILLHLHRYPIVNAHLHQRRQYQGSMGVVGCVSACRVYFGLFWHLLFLYESRRYADQVGESCGVATITQRQCNWASTSSVTEAADNVTM